MIRIIRVCPDCGRVYTVIDALFCVRCGTRTQPVDARTWGAGAPHVILKAGK